MALDLANNLGWAWHAPGMPRPFWGHLALIGPPGEFGQVCHELEVWLREKHLEMAAIGVRVTQYVFEAQHHNPHVDPRRMHRLQALAAIVEKFAWQVSGCDRDRPPFCYKAEIQTWRAHFLGRGTGFRKLGINPKVLCQSICAQHGWHTDSHDEADALGILDYSLSEIPNYERPWRDKALMGGPRDGVE